MQIDGQTEKLIEIQMTDKEACILTHRETEKDIHGVDRLRDKQIHEKLVLKNDK